MVSHDETFQELVESLKTLSESDLQFIARIVKVLGRPDPAEALDAFDEWAIAIAKRNKFEHLTEEQVAKIVQTFRE